MEKNVPQRTCMVCRNSYNKKDLLRIVRTSVGFQIDETGKLDGRGAYICKSKQCIEKCIKTKAMNRAFKTNIPDDVYIELKEKYLED